MSKNTVLEYLDCRNNLLTSLGVGGATALISLNCHDNQLTNLDVSKNTALKWLSCQNNQFSSASASLDALFGMLHSNATYGETIYISGNPGTATCDKSIATGKGWRVVFVD